MRPEAFIARLNDHNLVGAVLPDDDAAGDSRIEAERQLQADVTQ